MIPQPLFERDEAWMHTDFSRPGTWQIHGQYLFNAARPAAQTDHLVPKSHGFINAVRDEHDRFWRGLMEPEELFLKRSPGHRVH